MASQNIHISIPDPCHEDWAAMEAMGEMQRHCHVCSRLLTDFSQMTDLEIILQLQQNTKRVCGNFRPDQLNKNYLVPEIPQQRKKSPLKWLAALLLPFSSAAQNTGNFIEVRITDQNNQPVPHASVITTDLANGGNTDEKGYLKLYVGLNQPDSLKIHCIGYVSQKIHVTNSGVQKIVLSEKVITCPTVEITGNTLLGDVITTRGATITRYDMTTGPCVVKGTTAKSRIRYFFHRIFHPRHKHN